MKRTIVFSYLIFQAFIFNAEIVYGQMASTYQKAADLCEAAAKKYDALKCAESAAYVRKLRDWNRCMVSNLGNKSCGLEPPLENTPKCAAAMTGARCFDI